jgi:hypothetical protein
LLLGSIVWPALLLGAAPRAAAPQQIHDAARARPGARSSTYVGAALGSGAGVVLWWNVLGPSTEFDGAEALLTWWVTTSLVSALGGWTFTPPDARPGYGELFLGASVGVISGAVLMYAAGYAFRKAEYPPLTILAFSYSLGQGIGTAFLPAAR